MKHTYHFGNAINKELGAHILQCWTKSQFNYTSNFHRVMNKSNRDHRETFTFSRGKIHVEDVAWCFSEWEWDVTGLHIKLTPQNKSVLHVGTLKEIQKGSWNWNGFGTDKSELRMHI